MSQVDIVSGVPTFQSTFTRTLSCVFIVDFTGHEVLGDDYESIFVSNFLET